MKRKTILPALTASAGTLILILDAKTALSGARDGVMLCLNTLIPSLMPFFVLSTLLTQSLAGLCPRFLRPLGYALHIPRGAEGLLAVGVLGGYPVGAQNIVCAYRSGQLDRDNTARMLAFCNNAGPAFIFGVVRAAFTEEWAPWVLWGIHIASALMVGFFARPCRASCTPSPTAGRVSITAALESGVRVMALVCGWVVLFRTLLTFLMRWVLWALPVSAQVMIAGLLELSNGCTLLPHIRCAGLRFVTASGILALGGVCVTLQTASVCSGVSMARYYPGKLLQCAVSIVLAFICQPLFADRCTPPTALWVFLLLFGAIAARRNREKKGSICAPVGV